MPCYVDLVRHERLELLLVLIGAHIFELLLPVKVKIVGFIGPNELLEAVIVLFRLCRIRLRRGERLRTSFHSNLCRGWLLRWICA